MWTYFHVVVSMVKKTIDIPEDLYRKINEYRKMFDDIPSFTQAIIRLIKKGLKSEGIAVEEGA
jgi:predicted CopG family antitoxin